MKNSILVLAPLALFSCAAPRVAEPNHLSPELLNLAQELKLVEEALRKVESRLGRVESEIAVVENEFSDMTLDAIVRPRDLGYDASTYGGDVLLCRPTEWRGYGKMKRFTKCADPVFYLEAEGRRAVEARMAEGGVCNDDGSTRYVALYVHSPLEPGVTYNLRPRNDSGRYRWSIKGDLSVTAIDTAR